MNSYGLIPKVKQESITEGVFAFRGARVTAENAPTSIADGLTAFLRRTSGTTEADGAQIKLLCGGKQLSGVEKEQYSVTVSNEGIIIDAPCENGVFYGAETVKQLCLLYPNGIPCGTIYDKPSLEYRGFMLDVVRHFFGVALIKKYIDMLAFTKINTLHLHLTDDQGFRIQIEKYPKLTEIGSKRTQTLGDKKPVEGYFTKAELKDVVAYAAARYVTVIPEFGMPGHFTAAIASYPELGCTGKSIPVETTFGIKPNIICAGKENSYRFINDVLDEVVEIFPSEYIHVGGDEAMKLNWHKCENCQKAIKDNGIEDVFALQGFFTNKAIEHLTALGRRAIAWNEAINGGNLTPSAVCQYWSDGNPPSRVVREINNGRKTIVSQFNPLYMDYPESMHNLRDMYQFDYVLPGINPAAVQNVWGVEAPLWCEYVATEQVADGRIFPRLTAFAEMAWCDKAQRDYAEFEPRLKAFYAFYPLFNVQPSPLSDSNPKGLKKVGQHLKFAKNMLKPAALRSLSGSIKAQREIVKLRKDIEKKHAKK